MNSKLTLKEENRRSYIAIDLKSFYASVECVDRNLDPLCTNLVVADVSRTEKTICLAVSPSLKAYGIGGRSRLFEVTQRVKEINAARRLDAPNGVFTGSSCDANELAAHKELSLDFIAAPPRMAHYIECSSRIYEIYLHYVAREDIHVYSIDEVFMDVTHYLKTYNLTAKQLANRIILHILRDTGITATAGIAPNLYLCKVAMDIMAKHVEPDEDGVRIAELDELSYRKQLWSHQPLTDFWRIGHGYSTKLASYGLLTMGDIARCSLGGPNDFYNEDLLFKLFGVNAELLIDHAWGYEPTTMEQIKQYKPESNCISSGQVLSRPYTVDEARIIVREMADTLALDLLAKRMVTDQVVLVIGYDKESLAKDRSSSQEGLQIKTDWYGRSIPKHSNGTRNLVKPTCSSRLLTDALLSIYDETVHAGFLVRRLTITANHIISEAEAAQKLTYQQLSLFTIQEDEDILSKQASESLEKERKMQEAMLLVKNRYGKNAMLKGTNLQEGATMISRNNQIGGHHA